MNTRRVSPKKPQGPDKSIGKKEKQKTERHATTTEKRSFNELNKQEDATRKQLANDKGERKVNAEKRNPYDEADFYNEQTEQQMTEKQKKTE